MGWKSQTEVPPCKVCICQPPPCRTTQGRRRSSTVSLVARTTLPQGPLALQILENRRANIGWTRTMQQKAPGAFHEGSFATPTIHSRWQTCGWAGLRVLPPRATRPTRNHTTLDGTTARTHVLWHIFRRSVLQRAQEAVGILTWHLTMSKLDWSPRSPSSPRKPPPPFPPPLVGANDACRLSWDALTSQIRAILPQNN